MLQTSRYCWVIGNTGFRESALYEKIERYLLLLEKFGDEQVTWQKGQKRFFKLMQEEGLMEGGSNSERNAPKAARLKTSPLEKLGLITDNREITAIGKRLIERSRTRGGKSDEAQHYLDNDGDLYLTQLVKLQFHANREMGIGIRPFVLILRAIKVFGYLSRTELGFIMPLIIDESLVEEGFRAIETYRSVKDQPGFSKEEWLKDYLIAHKEKLSQIHEIKDQLKGKSQDFWDMIRMGDSKTLGELAILLDQNGKSRTYSLKLVPLLKAMMDMWHMCQDEKADYKKGLIRIFHAIEETSATQQKEWRQVLFGIDNKQTVKSLNEEKVGAYLKHYLAKVYEESLLEYFYRLLDYLWYIKILNNLVDYEDHNVRYFKLSGLFETLYEDGEKGLKLSEFYSLLSERILEDLPYYTLHFDKEVYQAYLYNPTYELPVLSDDDLMELADRFVRRTELSQVHGILERPEAMNPKAWLGELKKLHRLHRVDQMIRELKARIINKDDKNLLHLLKLVQDREDVSLKTLMDTEAEVPTIFEYLLWQSFLIFGDYVDDPTNYANFSLDNDLNPVQHAGGGRADVIYSYHDHDVILEATLTKEENQRKLEMEPVPRHLAKHRATVRDMTYCIFVAPHIDPNVATVHRAFRILPYYVKNDAAYTEVTEMAILPLAIEELQTLIKYCVHRQVTYDMMRQSLFKPLIRHEETDGYRWYKDVIKPTILALMT